MKNPDAVRPVDLPNLRRAPQEVAVRVAERDRMAEPCDDIEVWIVSRETVVVFDFYRGRPG